jgi:hypothetical protein
MDWSRLPRKFLTSWVDALRCRERAHSYGHDLTRELQLIGFNTDRPQGGRAAGVPLGISLSWGAAAEDKEQWRKLAARVQYRWRLWKRNPSSKKRSGRRNGLSLGTGLCQATWQY